MSKPQKVGLVRSGGAARGLARVLQYTRCLKSKTEKRG